MKYPEFVSYMQEKEGIPQGNKWRKSQTKHYNKLTIRTLRAMANTKMERRGEL